MPHNRTDHANIKPPNSFKTNNSDEAQPSKRRQKRPPKKITERYLHNAGLYYLERFAASSEHFKTVMRRKIKKSCMHHKEQSYEKCIEALEKVTQRFIETGLLNDELYTQGVVNSLRRQGLSKNAITMKMMQKGISKEQTLTALLALDEESYSDPRIAERAAAMRLARKKRIGPFYPAHKDEEDPQKSIAKLARSGFSYDTCRYVMDFPKESVDSLTGYYDEELLYE